MRLWIALLAALLALALPAAARAAAEPVADVTAASTTPTAPASPVAVGPADSPAIDGDVFGQVAPVPEELPANSERRRPFNRYEIDAPVRVDALNPSTWFDQQPHELAQFVWLVHRTVWRFSLSLTDWALNFSLLEGADSPLAVLEEVIQRVYASSAIQGLLLVALAIVGIHMSIQMITKQRFGQVLGEVLVMLVLFGGALWVINAPQQTVLSAANGVDRVSAELAGGIGGSSGGHESAAVATNELLHQTFIHEPWLVLQFGGLSHCPSGREPCRSTARRYGDNYLAYPPGSRARTAVYEAIRDGKTFTPPLFEDGNPSRPMPPADDLPHPPRAVEYQSGEREALHLQQGGAGLERVAIAVAILIGGLALAILLIVLALWVILAQMVVLFLLILLPFLMPLIFVPRLNRLVVDWASALVMALLTKLVAVVGLALLMLFSRVMIESNALGEQDFLLRYLLIAFVFWFVLVKRKMIFAQVQRVAGRVSSAGSAPVPLPAGSGAGAAARAATRFGAAVATGREQASPAAALGAMVRSRISAAHTSTARAPGVATPQHRSPSAAPSATRASARRPGRSGRGTASTSARVGRGASVTGVGPATPRTAERRVGTARSARQAPAEPPQRPVDPASPVPSIAQRVGALERPAAPVERPAIERSSSSRAPIVPTSTTDRRAGTDVSPARPADADRSSGRVRSQDDARRERERMTRERIASAQRCEQERIASEARSHHGGRRPWRRR